MILFKLMIFALISASCGTSREVLGEKTAQNNNNNNNDNKSPPFPGPFDFLGSDQRQLHLISESISDQGGFEVIEEFVDLDKGKDVFVIKNHDNGSKVLHIDAHSGLAYLYEAYKCELVKIENLHLLSANEEQEDAIWRFASLKIFNSEKKEQTNNGLLHLYGVGAVWSNVLTMKSIHTSSQMVYSLSKDMYLPASKWSFQDTVTKNHFNLYFSHKKNPKQQLEMIQIQSPPSEGGRTIRTINILLIEHSIPEESHETALELPVGFGCPSGNDSSSLGDLERSGYIFPLSADTYKIAVELSASKSRSTTGEQGDDEVLEETSTSGTVSLELVRAQVGDNLLHLVHQRRDSLDLKTILHEQFNVQYEIDLQSGQCKLSKIGPQHGGVLIELSNGLKLNMNLEIMRKLFVELEGFHLVKIVYLSPTSSLERIFIERSGNDLLPSLSQLSEVGNKREFRIIRSYVEQANDYMYEIQLESVSVLVLDEKKSQVIESYQFNVIEASELEGGELELAKLFDISEDCYLNNELALEGRDYIWLELTYPIQEQQIGLLAKRNLQLKEIIYDHFLYLGELDFFQAPRIELEFRQISGSYLIIRVLLIDRPPLEILYDAEETVSFQPDSYAGDSINLAIDLRHCAKLCQLGGCKTMTYCQLDYSCLLSTSNLKQQNRNENNRQLKANQPTCVTFTQPIGANFGQVIENKGLSRIVALFQHQEYGAIALPQMPDELVYSQTETGIDEETYRKISSDYMDEIYKFLLKKQHKVPMLTFSLNIDDQLIVLLPSKFELDQDPIDESWFAQVGNKQDNKHWQSFVEGLALHRLNLEALKPKNKDKTIGEDLETKIISAKKLIGLNYDQCALTCLDGLNCKTFSYCSHKQECIVSDSVFSQSTVEQDDDCIIMQLNFLAKFDKFKYVKELKAYKRSEPAFGASICAQKCLSDKGEADDNFRCLAFDYCWAQSDHGLHGTCYYLDHRLIESRTADNVGSTLLINRAAALIGANHSDAVESAAATIQCDHYSRSYLADFIRIEHRRLTELHEFSIDTIIGQTIDKCAEICAIESIACSAFQFCLDQDSSGPMQICTMIGVRGNQNNDISSEQEIFSGDDPASGSKLNKSLASSEKCHLFSLRRNSIEARMRNFAITEVDGGKTSKQYDKLMEDQAGLSIGGSLLLFSSMSLLFAAIACGLCLMVNQNNFLKNKLDRVRILLGNKAGS